MFITVFTRALSYARTILSISPHPISLILILILSFYLLPGLPNGLFPSGSTIKILYAFLLSICVLLALPSIILNILIILYVFRSVVTQFIKTVTTYKCEYRLTQLAPKNNYNTIINPHTSQITTR
jgi:hypothetical protein